MLAQKNDAKKLFIKKGPCSHAFFYILNREFGHHYDLEESAIDPLHGGIMQLGYQCGMLWGASMSVGAEAYRRTNSFCKAQAMAVNATRELMESYRELTNTNDCSDVTDTDFSSKFQMIKFMIFKAPTCFGLAKKWAPDAVEAANVGLSKGVGELPDKCMNCASEVVERMGGTEHQMTMVSGFAGGLGLSGNACGALSAAIWMKTLKNLQNDPEFKTHPNPDGNKIIEKFYKKTDYEILCKNITGKDFKDINEHTEYIKDRGCKELIEELSSC